LGNHTVHGDRRSRRMAFPEEIGRL
jgi:hypothetical protein